MTHHQEARGDQPDPPRCAVCRRRLTGLDADHGRRACLACQAELAQQLLAVAELWEELPGRLIKGTPPAKDPDAPKPVGAPGSAAPGNIDALNLLAGDVTGRLLVHEDDWRRDMRMPPTPDRGSQDNTLEGVLRFLRRYLSWACLHSDDTDGLARTLRTLLRDMQAVIDNDRRRPHALAVPCPLAAAGQGPGPDGRIPRCGGELVYEPLASAIRCRNCRRTVGYEWWADLAFAAGIEPTPDSRALAAALARPAEAA